VWIKVKNELLFSLLGPSHTETWMDLINVVTGRGSVEGSGSFCKAMLAKTYDLLPLLLVLVTDEELTWTGSVEDMMVHYFEVGGG